MDAEASTPTVRIRPRIGLSIPNRLVVFGRRAASLVDLAQRAEELGAFESLWVGDSLLAKPRLEALVLLGALSGRVTRPRLGTLCLASFPLREPHVLAIQLATLDILSNGRLVVGVCAGPGARGGAAAAAELDAFGVPSGERFARLEQGITRLRAMWGQGAHPVGETVALVEPRPVQRRVPILIATTPPRDPAGETRAIERVARLADGWQTDGLTPPRVGQLWSRMREAAHAAGRNDAIAEVVIHVPIVIDDDRRRAEDTARAFIARNAGAETAAVTLPEGGAFGPAGRAAELLSGLLEVGATTVVRFVSDDQEGQLDRLAADVLPALDLTRAA